LGSGDGDTDGYEEETLSKSEYMRVVPPWVSTGLYYFAFLRLIVKAHENGLLQTGKSIPGRFTVFP
jgi:hypothetical protein